MKSLLKAKSAKSTFARILYIVGLTLALMILSNVAVSQERVDAQSPAPEEDPVECPVEGGSAECDRQAGKTGAKTTAGRPTGRCSSGLELTSAIMGASSG